MNKILIIFGFCISIVFASIFVIAGVQDNWSIIGDHVFMNDDNVFISISPHTLSSSEYIYVNFTSKVYTGDADMVFGFDTTDIRPISAELFVPEGFIITRNYTCETDYFNYTVSPKHAWCYDNVTTANGSSLVLIYDIAFEWGNLGAKTVYWNATSYWRDYTDTFQSTNLEYQGMNKWYYARNIPIVEDKNYTLRVYVAGKYNGFNPAPIDTKYWFAIKPSSKTISQAISDSVFYALDPWFNSTPSDVEKDYLTERLIGYFPFNETSGNVAKNLLNYTSGNFTLYGTTIWSTGISGYGINFTASQYGENSTNIQNNTNMSISFWINQNVAQTNTRAIEFMGIPNATSPNPTRFMDLGSTVSLGPGAANTINYNIPVGVWQHIVITYNPKTTTGNKSLYVNGALNASVDVASSEFGMLRLGNHNNGLTEDWNGIVDELGVWTRPLNSSEVSDLYNAGAGIFFAPAGDTDPPVINITYPENTTYITDVSNLNYTYVDDNPDSCFYSIDNGATNSSDEAVGTNFTGVSNSQGTNTWTLYCNDTFGQSVLDNVTFYLDTVFPTVVINFPENITYSDTSLNFNVTSTDATGVNSCRYTLNNGTTNYTMTNLTAAPADYNHTNASISEGEYQAIFFCDDLLTNENSTESISFAIDTTNPDITINVPENITYTTTNINFNITATDASSLDTCWYTINTGLTNITMTNLTAAPNDFNQTNATLSQGSFTANFYCNDTVDNRNNSESVEFFIDSIFPVINITYPENLTYSVNVTELNYTYSDTNPGACWWSNNSGNVNSTSIAAGLNFTNVESADGSNTWTLYCNDSLGNTNSSVITFYKSINPPNITLISPIDMGEDADTIVDFVFNATSSNTIDNCSLIYGNNIVYKTVTSITSGEHTVIHIAGITEGHALYSNSLLWSINCTDTTNNQENSTTRRLDTIIGSGTGDYGSVGGGGGGGSTISTPSTSIELSKIEIFNEDNWVFDYKNNLTIRLLNADNTPIDINDIKVNIVEDINFSSKQILKINPGTFQIFYYIPKQDITFFTMNITAQDNGKIINKNVIIDMTEQGYFSTIINDIKNNSYNLDSFLKKYGFNLLIIGIVVASIITFIILVYTIMKKDD